MTDLSRPIPEEEYPAYLATEDWATEREVLRSLERLGHEARILGIHDDLEPIWRELARDPPDVVFNLCEGFAGDRAFEPHLVSLFELFRIPCTGTGAAGLLLCKDKGLTRKILSYHRIPAPKFAVLRRTEKRIWLPRELQYPLLIKPLEWEASEGIAKPSYAESAGDAEERLEYIHRKLETDAIAEEYIDGRELYLGVMGNERVKTLPVRELYFDAVPEGEPRIATFRAKWDDEYREKWGIKNAFARTLPEGVERRLAALSRKVFGIMGLRGFARMDLRLRPDGRIYFIEANPNPALGELDDFAVSAAKAGLDYDTLIARILDLSLGRR